MSDPMNATISLFFPAPMNHYLESRGTTNFFSKKGDAGYDRFVSAFKNNAPIFIKGTDKGALVNLRNCVAIICTKNQSSSNSSGMELHFTKGCPILKTNLQGNEPSFKESLIKTSEAAQFIVMTDGKSQTIIYNLSKLIMAKL